MHISWNTCNLGRFSVISPPPTIQEYLCHLRSPAPNRLGTLKNDETGQSLVPQTVVCGSTWFLSTSSLVIWPHSTYCAARYTAKGVLRRSCPRASASRDCRM